jgi:hypothetical protein
VPFRGIPEASAIQYQEDKLYGPLSSTRTALVSLGELDKFGDLVMYVVDLLPYPLQVSQQMELFLTFQ